MQIIILSLSLAYCWVDVLHIGSIKPFNCIMCMTGWFALALGLWCHGLPGIAFMPVGVFTGALFENLRMRYL